MRNLKENIKKIVFINISVIALLLVSIGTISMASSSERDYENKIKNLKSKYSKENVQFLDGVVIKIGETLNLREYISSQVEGTIEKISLEDENLVDIEGHNLKGKKSGTTFISLKINNSIHILEVLVTENIKEQRNVEKESKINRSYYKVFIDPGHGGEDPGAIGNGLRETDLNLQIAKKLKSRLEKSGVEVKMSRENETTVSLSKRAQMANEYGADTFVSIHQNSFTTSRAYGIETFYHTNKGQYREYAQGIQDALIKKTGGYNRGLKTANFAVIRESNMPSVLVECGFITNGNESAKLKTSSYQDKLASAMAESMEKYLENNIELITEVGVFKDTKNHWAKDVIKTFVNKGYVLGYEDGNFRPDKGITRAEFIKIVNKVFNFRGEAEENYLDVDNSNWYYHEVRKAVKAGYIDTKSKNFRPNSSITREEAAAIITTIKKNKDTNLDKLEKYKDKNKVSEWAKTSVEGAIEAEYMGREGNEFRPKEKVTRAETVAMLVSIK